MPTRLCPFLKFKIYEWREPPLNAGQLNNDKQRALSYIYACESESHVPRRCSNMRAFLCVLAAFVCGGNAQPADCGTIAPVSANAIGDYNSTCESVVVPSGDSCTLTCTSPYAVGLTVLWCGTDGNYINSTTPVCMCTAGPDEVCGGGGSSSGDEDDEGMTPGAIAGIAFGAGAVIAVVCIAFGALG